jgi:hypothetical protein
MDNQNDELRSNSNQSIADVKPPNNAKQAQQRYYQKNKEKLKQKTSEYGKNKRAAVRQAKAEEAKLLEALDPKPTKKKITRKILPLITEIKTGKFIFDIEW